MLDERKAAFKPLYDAALPIKEKIETIAREIYGADGVDYAPAAEKNIAQCEAMGLGDTPVCMAKTQYSFSDDPTKLGRPTGLPPDHPGRLSLRRRRLRRRARGRHHDHAGTVQDARRRSPSGSSRRHHRGTVLMAIDHDLDRPAPPGHRALQPGDRAPAGSCSPRARSRSIPPPGSWWPGGIAEQTDRVLQNIARHPRGRRHRPRHRW